MMVEQLVKKYVWKMS